MPHDLREGIEVRRGGDRQRRGRRHGWRSSSRSRENPRDGTLRRRTSPTGPGGHRGGQAALAVGRRPPARRRPGGARRRVRARRRGGGLDPRRRALRRARGTTSVRRARPRRCRFSRRASSRPRSTCATAREAGADAALLLLRDLDDATVRRLLDVAARARSGDARRSPRRRGARARSRARRAA